MRVWCKDVETFMVSAAVGMTFPATDRFEVAKLSASGPRVLLRAPSEPPACRAQAALGGERLCRSRRAALRRSPITSSCRRWTRSSARRAWLAGDSYSLADAETTPYVAMLELLDFHDWWRRMPRIDDWYERVKSRPSFRTAITDAMPQVLRADMAARGATGLAGGRGHHRNSRAIQRTLALGDARRGALIAGDRRC